MTTGGHAKQPTGLQETEQEKEGDKTRDGELSYEHIGALLGHRQLRIE